MSKRESALSPLMSNNDLLLSDEAAAWFARLGRGDLSEQDIREFETWKHRSPAHQRAWAEVCSLWNDPAIIAAAHIAVGSAHPTGGAVRFSRSRRRAMTAAAVGLLAAIACLVLVGPDFLLQLQADDWTAIGEQRSLQLPDGSAVTMNTKTAIATEFVGSTRRVRLLTGEAFFAVGPDPHKPFVVESRNVVARALGTAFLVKEQGDGLRIAVAEGTVDVRLRGDGPSHVQLRAGQQVEITADRLNLPTPANPELLTAWLRGRLIFDSAPLTQVIEELNRYHAGRIVLLSSNIRQLQVSGTYDLSDTSAILDTLAQTLPIHRMELTPRLVLLC
jgi:transmembrane sensor